MAYKIKEIRKKRKLSQQELADLSGVSRANIVRLENEPNVETNVGTLMKLAKALNCSVKSLFLD